MAEGQTDEGAFRKWFGAPGSSRPTDNAVLCRHGGRLIAAPTKTAQALW